VNVGLPGVLLLALFFGSSFWVAVSGKGAGRPVLLASVTASFIFSLFDNGVGSRVMPTWMAQAQLAVIVAAWANANPSLRQARGSHRPYPRRLRDGYRPPGSRVR
jgi:hypothetical protein